MKNAKKLLSYSYFGFFTALLLSAPAMKRASWFRPRCASTFWTR